MGIGKVQILKMELQSSEGKDPVIIYKVVFKNAIGKILYKSSITASGSKVRKIVEKSFKNQLKVAVAFQDVETNAWKNQFCLLNFHRNDDMESF